MVCFLQKEHQSTLNSNVIVFYVKDFICCNKNGEKKTTLSEQFQNPQKELGFLRIDEY